MKFAVTPITKVKLTVTARTATEQRLVHNAYRALGGERLHMTQSEDFGRNGNATLYTFIAAHNGVVYEFKDYIRKAAKMLRGPAAPKPFQSAEEHEANALQTKSITDVVRKLGIDYYNAYKASNIAERYHGVKLYGCKQSHIDALQDAFPELVVVGDAGSFHTAPSVTIYKFY